MGIFFFGKDTNWKGVEENWSQVGLVTNFYIVFRGIKGKYMGGGKHGFSVLFLFFWWLGGEGGGVVG